MPQLNKASILIIDDQPEIRSVLCQALAGEGYSVQAVANKAEALLAFEASDFDLVTLDLRLGAEDGMDLVAALRGRKNVPVIIITGKGDATDRICGLEQGADDYIVKPFALREVLLRVQNALRRYGGADAETRGLQTELAQDRRYGFDHCELDPKTREVKSAHAGRIDLTDYEYRLLALLVANAARVLSRSEISMAMNGHDWSPLDRTIDGHIARLRRKIEIDEDEPRLIKSVRNVGYVFTGEVTVTGEAAPA